MQIDGHHTATYVAARCAGFCFEEAEIIAYAAQYVDDATNEGPILFDNSPFLYARIASAHKMIDYNNLLDVRNHLAWVPFHFLPGNCGEPANSTCARGEIAQLICRPDSHVARDMLRAAFQDSDQSRALHRLGIAMHVYADTFAHQGFVGALSVANQASDVTTGSDALDREIRSTTKTELLGTAMSGLRSVWSFMVHASQQLIKEKKWPAAFFSDFLKKSPVGHAAVDVFPDLPFLTWQYRDFQGCTVVRKNTTTFLHAIQMMTKALQAWRAGDEGFTLENYPGLEKRDEVVVERLLAQCVQVDAEQRRQSWLNAISNGDFSFGTQVPQYVAKGIGSWKEIALGTPRIEDTGFERFFYRPEFLNSHWKLFHDALQAHRRAVVHDILPRFGICAA